ncbi:YgiQ family radical SAM protein [Portibacter marinus]|uniref:YgiQ family radical SAM protein n=1 Tax=Portibacter marinus TaxID=2898660 RepID=UPI001F1A945A|nr:YgiQ family radical SAM protein [Portibacter marinus]
MIDLPIVEHKLEDWMPITRAEMEARGWQDVDVVLISGDAYVDHPAFGTAVIGRIMESEGLRVAVVPQPNWQDDLRDFKKFGRPRLFFGVTSGCMDSMVNHYTASKRKRSTDAYTPGGNAGFRPDYALTVYTQILKKLYPDVPVLIGGIEASLRRVTHYDYWKDELFPNILTYSGADLLVYGMGEMPLREIIRLLLKGVPFESLKTIPQTGVLVPRDEDLPKVKKWEDLHLSSHEKCLRDKTAFAANFKHIEQESNKVQAKRLIQGIGDHHLVINPPYPPMTEDEIDTSFDLPYTRLPHPKYKKRGAIPAYEMIKFSINMHRGCFGGCSFCTISAHQGKFVASRSEESILKEVDKVTQMPDFKGVISDLGGPSANMYKMKGKIQSICDRCVAPSCIHPVVCSNLDTSHKAMTEIYRKVDAHPAVKRAYVGSGIRYDLLVDSYNKKADGSQEEYMEQLVSRHVCGRLKVAPEHTSDATLRVMRKPSFKHFHEFKKRYDRINDKYGLKQPLIPYFISSHPGSTEEEMANLAAETKDMGFRLEQVQDFTPTPMTVATIIYYTGLHPYTLKPIYTAKTKKEKKKQHMFFFWHKRENYQQIKDKLTALDRPDLIEKLLEDKKKARKKEIIKSKSKHHDSNKNQRKKSNVRKKRR